MIILRQLVLLVDLIIFIVGEVGNWYFQLHLIITNKIKHSFQYNGKMILLRNVQNIQFCRMIGPIVSIR